jgi:molecular chaperone GrpE
MVNEFDNQEQNIVQEAVDAELTSCKAQLEEVKNRLMRATADFENFKKRLEKERGQWAYTAQAAVLNDLLPIVNDFERALTESQKQATVAELKAWLVGFEMIRKSLYKLLHKYEVEEITDFSVFNPELHEALMRVESHDHKSGEVVAVLEKGFTFRGQVLRPAKVSVAQ